MTDYNIDGQKVDVNGNMSDFNINDPKISTNGINGNINLKGRFNDLVE